MPPDGKRPKGNIHWVPENALPVEVRLYNHLFTVPFVTDNWENEVNPTSEVIVETALVDPSVMNQGVYPSPETHFQFERVGVFVVDKDSKNGKLVVNRTVPLKVDTHTHTYIHICSSPILFTFSSSIWIFLKLNHLSISLFFLFFVTHQKNYKIGFKIRPAAACF
jgi:hypothetical protein